MIHVKVPLVIDEEAKETVWFEVVVPIIQLTYGTAEEWKKEVSDTVERALEWLEYHTTMMEQKEKGTHNRGVPSPKQPGRLPYYLCNYTKRM